MEELLDRLRVPTPRERDVMKLVVSGLLNKQVAGEFEITENTVKAHQWPGDAEDESQLGSRFGENDARLHQTAAPNHSMSSRQ